MAITRLGPNQLVNLASNVTGTLPAANVANSTLNNVTALPAAIATGKIKQVVNSVYSTVANFTSGSYTDVGLTANITPSSSSNKVLIILNVQIGKGGGSHSHHGNIKLLRDSTELNPEGSEILDSLAYDDTAGYLYPGSASVHYLDTPNTTSQITYKIQAMRAGNSGTFTCQPDGSASSMTLMEVVS